jgi:hypothetical protein
VRWSSRVAVLVSLGYEVARVVQFTGSSGTGRQNRAILPTTNARPGVLGQREPTVAATFGEDNGWGASPETAEAILAEWLHRRCEMRRPCAAHT